MPHFFIIVGFRIQNCGHHYLLRFSILKFNIGAKIVAPSPQIMLLWLLYLQFSCIHIAEHGRPFNQPPLAIIFKILRIFAAGVVFSFPHYVDWVSIPQLNNLLYDLPSLF